MAGNSGAWGIAILNPRTDEWVSLSGGEEIDPYLPSEPLGCLLVPPDGMGVPGLRTEDLVFTQRDGVNMYSDWYENRIVTLTVSVCNDGCPGCPTARAKVREIMRAWSRMCGETELRIFTDCHDPTLSDPAVTGPYTVIGRPRQALVAWRRSNFGCASLTLRFDALDHRLLIPGPDGEVSQCSPLLLAQEVRTNLSRDPALRNEAAWVEFGGSTGTVSSELVTRPHDQGYLSYTLTTANTATMRIDAGGSGIGGIPVVEGSTYMVSVYWAANSDVTTQDQMVGANWFDAAGTLLSSVQGSDLNPGAPSGYWWRGGEAFTAPAGAAFMQPLIFWDGIYQAGGSLFNNCLLVEETTEMLPWFSGNFLGSWLGDPDGSTSTSPYTRRNYVANPLPDAPAGDTWSIASDNTATWTVDSSGGPDTEDSTIAFPGTQVAGFHRIVWPASGGQFNWFRPDLVWVQESPQQAGTPFRMEAWVRVNQSITGLELQATQYETGNLSAFPPDVVSLDGIPVDTWTLVEVSGVIGSDVVSFVSPVFSASSTPLPIPAGFELNISLVIVEYDPVAPEIYFDGTSDGAAWGGAANGSISGISFVEFSEVQVEGDLCASLTIELTGPLTAPIIVQETTPDDPNYGVENGKFVQYNENIAPGETVTINTRTRSATSSQETLPVTGNVTGNLSWQMDPGTHLLSMSAAGGSGVAMVCWSGSVVSG